MKPLYEQYLNKIREDAEKLGYKAEVKEDHVIIHIDNQNVIIEDRHELDELLKEEYRDVSDNLQWF